MKADPRDERIAELEARIDKLVDAIAELASRRPTVVYPMPYVPYVPIYPSWTPRTTGGTYYYSSGGTVTILSSPLSGPGADSASFTLS